MTPAISDRARWLDAHPGAKQAFETFCATGDESTSQGWEDTAALISPILPAECLEGRCEH